MFDMELVFNSLNGVMWCKLVKQPFVSHEMNINNYVNKWDGNVGQNKIEWYFFLSIW